MKSQSKYSCSLLCLLLFTAIAIHWGNSCQPWPSMLHADTPPPDSLRLDKAESFYYNGEFDRAISSANQCLVSQEITAADRFRTHQILVRSYLAQGDTVRARENARIILLIEPDYYPTIEQETPRYVSLFTEVRQEHPGKPESTGKAGLNKWIWIGAGGATAAAILVVVVSGGNGNHKENGQPLPEPPPFP